MWKKKIKIKSTPISLQIAIQYRYLSNLGRYSGPRWEITYKHCGDCRLTYMREIFNKFSIDEGVFFGGDECLFLNTTFEANFYKVLF